MVQGGRNRPAISRNRLWAFAWAVPTADCSVGVGHAVAFCAVISADKTRMNRAAADTLQGTYLYQCYPKVRLE